MKTIVFERSAEVEWTGSAVRGTGLVKSGSGSFTVEATYPTLRGEPAGVTTPEELLAASHALCFAIGLRSVIARRGGEAAKVTASARVAAEKGNGVIRIVRSDLQAVVTDLTGIDRSSLEECAAEAKRECTITNALGPDVVVGFSVSLASGSATAR